MASSTAQQPSFGLDSTLRAFADLGRISNLPTCVSNVLVGVALGAAASPGDQPHPVAALWLSAAVCLLYVGGTALNDVADSRIDRRERPSRPIPSGRVSLATAIAVVGVCFVVGLAILAFFGLPVALLGLTLVSSIVAYDLLHKRIAASVLLMGVCRGLVYLVAAAAVGWPLRWGVAGPPATALALYVVGITVVARAEAQESLDARRWLAVAMPIVVLLPSAFVHLAGPVWPLVGIVALGAWLAFAVRAVFARPPRTVQAVLTWLSGISLVDAFFLTLLDRPGWAAVAGACFVVTAWGHRHVLGT